jgi:hypothetical protein
MTRYMDTSQEPWSADIKNEALVINGTTVKMISASNPEDIDYTCLWY